MSGSGTLTLAGTGSTYNGSTTLNSGILSQGVNAGSNVLGATSSIIFNGGTLQYASSGGTTDFSSKFSQAASQQYKIDTNGSTNGVGVTCNTALTSSGGSLTKLGAGVLNLGGANTNNGGTAEVVFGWLVITPTTAETANDGTAEFSYFPHNAFNLQPD